MAGQAFRDLEWEKRVQEICQESSIGAQFGGKYLTHDVRVIRFYLDMPLRVRLEWAFLCSGRSKHQRKNHERRYFLRAIRN